MPRSSPGLLTLVFLVSLVVPDAGTVAAEGDRTYVYDHVNLGWAYCCDPDEEDNWIRLDLGAVGQAGPPDDALGRPIYVIAPGSSEHAYSGSAELESNWVSLEGWREPTSAGAGSNVGSPTLTPTILPTATALRPTFPTRTPPAVDSQSPPAGTYELSPTNELLSSAGCCYIYGMYLPLTFPESWRGRLMRVTTESVRYQPRDGETYLPARETNAWPVWLYWSTTRVQNGDYFVGSGACPPGPRPEDKCSVAGWDSTVSQWRISPGEYFLFFEDHHQLRLERKVLSLRVRLQYPT